MLSDRPLLISPGAWRKTGIVIALVQRVSEASVTIEDSVKSSIESGLLVFLGIQKGDNEDDACALAGKLSALRIFSDADGKMNLALTDTGGEALVVSQFTLCADTRKGNRPSFIDAAPPDQAVPLYQLFLEDLAAILGTERVKSGTFGADMKVTLINDGPVTISLTAGAEAE